MEWEPKFPLDIRGLLDSQWRQRWPRTRKPSLPDTYLCKARSFDIPPR
jgi:hypothetical protein